MMLKTVPLDSIILPNDMSIFTNKISNTSRSRKQGKVWYFITCTSEFICNKTQKNRKISYLRIQMQNSFNEVLFGNLLGNITNTHKKCNSDQGVCNCESKTLSSLRTLITVNFKIQITYIVIKNERTQFPISKGNPCLYFLSRRIYNEGKYQYILSFKNSKQEHCKEMLIKCCVKLHVHHLLFFFTALAQGILLGPTLSLPHQPACRQPVLLPVSLLLSSLSFPDS